MPSIFKRINQAYIDADNEANKKVIRNNFKFVSQNNQQYNKPSILDDITVFNIDKYFEEFKANTQNIIDNYLKGEKNNNATKVISIYNIIVSYIKNFAKDNAMSQRDKANIQDKFDEIKPIVKQVLDIAIKTKFSDVAQIEQLFENLDNRAYFEVKMTHKQVADFNKKIAEAEKPKVVTELIKNIDDLFNELFNRKTVMKNEVTGKVEEVRLFDTLLKTTRDAIFSGKSSKYEKFKNTVNKLVRDPTINREAYNKYFYELYNYLKPLVQIEPPAEETEFIGMPEREDYKSLLKDELNKLEQKFRTKYPSSEYYTTTGKIKKEYIEQLMDTAEKNISSKLDIEEITPEQEEKIIQTITHHLERQGTSDEDIDDYIKKNSFKKLLKFYNEIKMMKKEGKIAKRETREREREEERQMKSEIDTERIKRERKEKREEKLRLKKLDEELEKSQQETEARLQKAREENEKKKEIEARLQKAREEGTLEEYQPPAEEIGQGKPRRKAGRPKKIIIEVGQGKTKKKVGRPSKKTTVEQPKKKAGRPRKQILKSFVFENEEENKIKPDEIEFELELGMGKKKYNLKQRGGVNKMKQKK